MTCGLLTMFMFGAVITKGSDYVIIMFDHWAKSCNLSILTEGYISAMFWFAMIWVVITITALLFLCSIALAFDFSLSFMLDLIPFSDAFWFSYISMTTIGLGDYNIPSYSASILTMFTVPLFQLFGFVIISIFIEKATLAVVHRKVIKDTSNDVEESIDDGDELFAYSRNTGHSLEPE